MNDFQRIVEVQKSLGFSSLRQMAAGLGMKTPQTFYDIKKGKHGITKELASLILEHTDELNELWILTGRGPMLSSHRGYDAINIGGDNSINGNRGSITMVDAELLIQKLEEKVAMLEQRIKGLENDKEFLQSIIKTKV